MTSSSSFSIFYQHFLHFQGANNYTYDEIQIALSYCTDGDPLTWLNENWSKLIETVQTLATKYGQEHKENIVGTISSAEAREALKVQKGNVWQAITECIEKRQFAFNTIQANGRHSREDIVTYLTSHNGNIELALAELERIQKPFLLRIPEPPTDDGTTTEMKEDVDLAQANIHQVLNAGKDEERSNILRDIEAIIVNMEEKQSKKTDTILNTIESLLNNAHVSQSSRPLSSASNFSMASLDRIDVRSPITIPPKLLTDSGLNVENEVKNFVSQHIQDIMPDVAAKVHEELSESHDFGEYQNVGINYEEAIANVIIEPEAAASHDIRDEVIPMSALSHASPSIEQVTATNQPSATEEIFNLNDFSGGDIPQEDVPLREAPLDVSHPQPSTSFAIKSNSMENLATIDKTYNENEQNSQTIKYATLNVNNARGTKQKKQKARIRDLERQLRAQQKLFEMQRNMRNESRSPGLHTDLVDQSINLTELNETPITENSGVSNEETFVFSIAEPAFADNERETEKLTTQTQHVQANLQSNADEAATKLIIVLDEVVAAPEAIEKNENDENSALNDQPEKSENDDLSTGSYNDHKAKDSKKRDLSELVADTKSLIQQMKNEIDEDIAMSASEFDDDLDDEMDEETYYGSSDSWEDIEDDSDDFDDAESVESLIHRHDAYSPGSDEEFSEYTETEVGTSEVDSEGEGMLTDRIEFEEEQAEAIAVEKETNQSFAIGAASSDSPAATENVTSSELIESNANEVLLDVQTENSANQLEEGEENEEKTKESFLKDEGEAEEISVKDDEDAEMVSASTDMIATSEAMPELIETIVHETQVREEFPVPFIEGREAHEPLQTQINTDSNLPDTDSNLHKTETETERFDENITALIEHSEEETDDESEEESDDNTDQQSSNIAINDSPDPDLKQDGTVWLGTLISEDDETAVNVLPADVAAELSEKLQPDEQLASQADNLERNEDSSIILGQSEPIDDTLQYNDSESDAKYLTVSDTDSHSHEESSSSTKRSINSNKSPPRQILKNVKDKKGSSDHKQTRNGSIRKSPSNVNKIPVRRPSLSEPSFAIKNIQNELLNKQTKIIPKTVSKKPSKIVPPKLFFKDGITKTRDETSLSNSSKHIKPTSNDEPSTSKGITRSIPKKKYYETCFSDDYQTSDDEKQPTSRKVIPNLVKIVESTTEESFDFEVSEKATYRVRNLYFLAPYGIFISNNFY